MFIGEIMKNKSLDIFTGTANPEFAQEVSDILGIRISAADVGYFSDGELNVEIEENAKEVIQLGEIVYWPTGKVIAIGFGKTPISLGDEIRLASKCNVWANTSFDLKKLVNVRQGEKVLVEKSRI